MDLIQLSSTHPVATAAAALVMAGASTMLYYFVIEPATNSLNALPGPPSSHWFFGSMKEIISAKWEEGNYPEPFLSWVKKYGGAVHFREALTHRVMLSDPEALKHVHVVNNDNYPRAMEIRNILRVILGGDGLLSTEGETHHHMRKMLTPHFGFAKVREFVDSFAHHARQLSNHLKQVADQGVAVDMHEFFTKMTLDVIGVCAFGYNFGSLENANDRVLDAYKVTSQPPELFNEVAPMYIPGFDKWPLPHLAKKREAKRILLEKVDNVIASKLQAPRDVNRPTDLVDLILEVEAGQHRVTPEEARCHVMTFMFAGHETTSTTLSWVLAMLATHPEMENIVRKECQAVAATSEGGVISSKSLSELKYTTAFIQETLRVFPTAVHTATRECLSDDHVPMSDGKPIFFPKGTTIYVSLVALHRNPKYWSQPDEFIPERFLEGSAVYEANKGLRNGHGNTFTYMPFSAGPKNCIGMRFAMAELQVVISNLLLQFSFRLTDKANISPQLTTTLRPVDLNMTIHSVA
ncbi:hypothetical protein AeMF1_005900 [Aphanomyces euteiches]|nr:hypothetical protein AeMF1_005900 [Aphanomyces euteiches]KAH9187473.1 hypothetical protein AeNC1_010549 [Aphanomyces euteiches]